jgi:hypothetical protein
MKAQDTIGFVIDGSFDPTRPLVIDPVLAYSTYLGGSNTDRGFAPAIDHHGKLYLTGTTAALNFPVDNPEQSTNGGNFDAFVAKFSADGELEYATYFGGSRFEEGFGIAVDEHGSAYVSGRTGSPDMPVVSALQPVYGGGPFDAFVMKLDPSGSRLLFSTFLGGTGDDRAFDLRLDARDRVFVSGTTASTNFPIVNGLQPFYAGNTDAFLSTMSDDGSALLYSTYLGGSGAEQFGAIAVDNAGRAAVVGRTSSLDFPVENAVQPIFGGGPADAFVARYNEFGSGFIYSTNLGGSGDDSGISSAVTRDGDVFVGGNTNSPNYPVVNALQPMFAGVRDMIITRLDRSGQIVFSTYLGGSGNENAFGLAVDAPGNLYVSGFTTSPNFPTRNALYATPRGGVDAVFAKISRAGDSLIYSTYFGGSGEDRGDYIAVDPSGNAYFCGWTGSLDFPTTPGAFQPTFGGPQFDAFVVKLADDRPTLH